jgi:(p)ppGpp synthase/HD superfamily hydrolase
MITKEELIVEIKKNGIYTDLVEKALRQAQISHAKQKRENGTSNLKSHIYSVTYSILKRYKGKRFLEDLVILALLHDTMEDDSSFNISICKRDFNEDICKNVKKLTKDGRNFRHYSGDNVYLYELLKFFCNKEYIENIKDASEVCKIVKLEDRINNLQSTKKVGASPRNMRYVMESATLFVSMAKKTKSFNYVPLLAKEIKRLSNSSS